MSVITFNDACGVEQSVDLEQGKFNLAFNADCMDFLLACPDKCIDLAVVDPPYGDGSLQIGNVERERERGGGTDSVGGSTDTRKRNLRFHGGSKNPNDPWNKYLRGGERVISTGVGGTVKIPTGSVTRTWGTWAEKYGKKS